MVTLASVTTHVNPASLPPSPRVTPDPHKILVMTDLNELDHREN